MKLHVLFLLISLIFLWGERDASAYSWTQSDRLNAHDEAERGHFGHSTSMGYFGELLVVGSSPPAASWRDDRGSAYIFRRDGQNWTEEMGLYPAYDLIESDRIGFGYSVGTSSTTYNLCAVGAPQCNEDNSGAVFIYGKDNGSWTMLKELSLSSPPSAANLGYSVDMNRTGRYVIASAPGAGGYPGMAYVFYGWVDWALYFTTSLEVPETVEEDDFYGYAVGIDPEGEYAIVGAHDRDDDGKAYIYQRTSINDWDLMTQIVPLDPENCHEFGCSVAISGRYAIVGDHGNEVDGEMTGAAYVFFNNATGWVQIAKIEAPDRGQSDHFGFSVDITHDYAIVGSYHDDDEGADAGAAYIFQRTGIFDWDYEAKLTASDAGADDDWFGSSVSLSHDNDYAVAGARAYEGSEEDCGAAYIYHKGLIYHSNPDIPPCPSSTAIALVGPQWNERLITDDFFDIRWEYDPCSAVEHVNLEFHIDNKNWIPILGGKGLPVESGRFKWRVPKRISSNRCQIRITEDDPNKFDNSRYFTVFDANGLLVLRAPKEGEVLWAGASYPIRWYKGDDLDVTHVKLEYQAETEPNWIAISTGVPNTGAYLWENIPPTISRRCLMRISDVSNPSNHDISRGMFAIDSGLKLKTPAGGEVLKGGAEYEIRWASARKLNIANVRLEYSINNGADWDLIVASAPNNNSWEWAVPALNAKKCLIRISASGNPGIFNISRNTFGITTCNNRPNADWDGNCRVNFLDLRILAGQWLKCGDPFGVLCHE
ncbi:MAG: FG-GAP repeat protein [Planctomycetota bacterium]|jgi:hypothetical protein